jgi:hypothetical protein
MSICNDKPFASERPVPFWSAHYIAFYHPLAAMIMKDLLEAMQLRYSLLK